MTLLLFIEQVLNGLQLGTMLFLMAAGLTLVFGIMHLINLAHGSLYMIGAYVAATVQQATGSFLLGLLAALPAAALAGMAMEAIALRRLYDRDHLDQVLATFGLILFFNELVKILWGPQAYFMAVPEMLSGSVEILPGAPYPAYRLAIVAAGIAAALFLYLLITRTRIGMLIRAGATNREMVNALGVNVDRLYMLVFGLGAALAGLAGVMAGPLLALEVGMGENILILAFVVIVIGGIGSVRGAFVAALLVGIADTFGRVLLPGALSEMTIYILMAAILVWRPQGLFPSHA
ncbi:branched-chain amino acid ABC transporter permease [Oceanibaculum indicum]|uniref:Branched-chain amino acid transport system permease protein n=1 Tax=Oceanibaculum indicum TaxID=526216 RepID=A0A420WQJ2_9PROT|nr:branched-chain amino acid ABC transporter permease [Oceanibaculum indicum]RKQ73321.1 branched-chain amino acid transport system permease protein [Oceanibaculum indicum]